MAAAARLAGLVAALAGSVAAAAAATDVARSDARPPDPGAADRDAIAAAASRFSAAFENGDIDGLVDSYTEDAVLLPRNATVRGRDAIRRRFAAGATDVLRHATCSRSLDLHGDVAIDVGTWFAVQESGGDRTRAAGRYLVAWRRAADGRWRMSHDAWHVPSPPADAASSTYWRMNRAIGAGDVAEVHALLAEGADPTGACDYLEFLPVDETGIEFMAHLATAARAGQAPVLEALLAAGADPDLAEGADATPLMVAAERGDETIVSALLAAGADPAHRSVLTGRTAADEAARHGHDALADRLRRAGLREPGSSF